jgi:transcriptional regulator with XRE-family HTH domain
MADLCSFPSAFAAVRGALGLTQKRVAQLHGVSVRTVERWSLGRTLPSLADRTALLRTLRDAPRPLLEALAQASGTTLAAAAPAAPPARAVDPRVVDDAVRELAEDLDVTARALRPALGRFVATLARAEVPLDVVARVVTGRRGRARR